MALPNYFSWRYSGVLPRAFHQRNCDSCSTAAALYCCSCVLCISQQENGQRARPQLFSVQEPVNRIPEVFGGLEAPDLNGCHGIPTRLAFRYIRQFQCARRADMPYQGRRTGAHPPLNRPRLFIDNYVSYQEEGVHVDADHWPDAIVEIVPMGGGDTVTDVINCHPIVGKAVVGDELVGDENFINRTPNMHPNMHLEVGIHALLMVGYGTSADGVEFFECLNSWGPEWGDHGFCLVERSSFLKFYYPVNPRVEGIPFIYPLYV
ncbi:hypothetical protein RHMOL_Rhmol07G0142300 [Rhododendron molle]|uniref:Uncharacterized protein n=1 Tax=Rhododendron molle TaxID=49168 RepID=A0ACC0N085_RHOML|nr:hypothetical protein RHMOL_Rhmol07G0142300 [Rhododendron molle]